jgi:putative transposase
MQGLTDRSRRPYRYANQLPFQVENFILNVKHEHPSWGARKIRERLLRRFSGIPIPAKSTIHAVLDRGGLVERRGRVRRRAHGTPLSLGYFDLETRVLEPLENPFGPKVLPMS